MTAPCAHCAHPEATHGRRYAALPGWHDWVRDVSGLVRYANGGWLPFVGLAVVRNDTGAVIVVRPAPHDA